jgi:DNA-binding transcriptional LysR family regulator
MIDIRLYTLLEVVKYNSYTRAAEHLSLTQPAVTQHIKQLEKELNIKIFSRVGKELKLTKEGNIVLQYARRNIALYERMKQNLLD